MNENDFIVRLKAKWPKDAETSLETLALTEEAVRVFPRSARLWCIRGDLIQLGPETCELDDARACYERAIELDPQFAEAWESLGHFYDSVLDDGASARKYFSEAERLKENNVA